MYKLLTPGPLTTSETVKAKMMQDVCTWDDDFKNMTQYIRQELVKIADVDAKEYTTVLMQGSGTFGVESVLTSVIQASDKILVLANGEYGKRMTSICQYHKIPYVQYLCPFDQIYDANDVERIIQNDSSITHVAMIHSETTTGILNDLEAIKKLALQYNLTFIVDAMSSFGGIPIQMSGIDFLISSANKCIQGVPGFSFVIANRKKLIASKGVARSLSLDLYDQWETMEKDGKWRFTAPTHAVLAFKQALKELQNEGGVMKRNKRYKNNQRLLVDSLSKLGFQPYLPTTTQGEIITTFYYPKASTFDFKKMYDYVKAKGFALYPGKLTDVDTFRVGNIGDIYIEDIYQLYQVIKQFLEDEQYEQN